MFLIIDLYFLIPVVIAQIFNPIAELVIHIEILIKEAKSELEIHPVIAETKIRKFSIQFRVYFLLINTFCFISSRK